MTRPSTRVRILDTAEKLFAEHGYAATSLRQVSGKARVNLGSIHYYFKSKQALFREVLQRRILPLDEKRVVLLDKLQRDGELTLENVIEAFIGPTLDLALSEKSGVVWVKFVARSRLEPGKHWHPDRSHTARRCCASSVHCRRCSQTSQRGSWCIGSTFCWERLRIRSSIHEPSICSAGGSSRMRLTRGGCSGVSSNLWRRV